MSKKRESVLKKNDEINLEITALTSQGSGVGRFNSMAVFVEGTAPGDVIVAHIILVKSNYAVGIIKKILKPSKHRIVCDCGAFSSCGGCSFRHIDYDEELAFKKQRVQDAFNRIGGIDTQVKEIITAGKVERYRNKAQYPVAMTPEGKTLIGFYAKKSHRVIDCRNCLLQPEEFGTFLGIIEKWAAQYGVTIYNEKENRGLFRHIYIRKGFKTGQIMICIVSTSRLVPKIERLIEALVSCNENIKSIVLNVNSEDTNVVLSTDCRTLWGSDFIEDELCGLKFKISPLSFFQVNPDGAEILYKKAAEYAALSGKETLLDLYCGTGTIGLSMAKNAKRVIGVEIIPQAIENAKENAKENGICNAEFFCDDASGAAKRISESKTKIDVIVLDPPRKGCSRDVIEAVAAMNPKRVVYVSCDPATLARDCAEFKKAGFETDEITAVDMFPRTTHVETVVLLSHKKADSYIHIDVEFGEGEGKIPVDSIAKRAEAYKPKEKVTYKMIKEYIEAKYGFKVHTAYIAEVKRNLGLPMYDVPNAVEELKQTRKHPTAEKVEAIKDAWKHFNIVE